MKPLFKNTTKYNSKNYNEFINFNYEKYDVEFRKNIFDKYYCTEAEFIFRTKSIEI